MIDPAIDRARIDVESEGHGARALAVFAGRADVAHNRITAFAVEKIRGPSLAAEHYGRDALQHGRRHDDEFVDVRVERFTLVVKRRVGLEKRVSVRIALAIHVHVEVCDKEDLAAGSEYRRLESLAG
jgi:hypothetical protein